MGYRFIVRIMMGLIWIFAAYKWGKLERWKQYYPSMLFFGFGDALYNMIFLNRKLWTLKYDFLQSPFHELYVIFTIFFSTALLYLIHYPEDAKWLKKAAYVGIWVGIYTAIELLTFQLDMIVYSNGWNIYWSILFNIFIFMMLRIHYINPIAAWSIGFIMLGAMIKIFRVPVLIPK